jgi:hypothetical protein
MVRSNCQPTNDSISKETLLALINDGSETSEVQTITILSQNGFPNAGNFTLGLSPTEVTDPISYYADNQAFSARRIQFALRPFADTQVAPFSNTQFRVTFIGDSIGVSFPLLQVVDNNLTLDGHPAGNFRIARVATGSTANSAYKLLRDLPEDQWEITSYNPRTRAVCVTIDSGVSTSVIFISLPATIV